MSGRSRFAVASLALSLAIAIGAPAIAHTTGVAIGVAIFVLAAPVALLIGLGCGARFDALVRRSLEDPVTRVGNRRHWDERLADEVVRAQSSHMPLSLLLIDLDELKKLNDSQGHGCGDRALKLVGEVLLATCRSRDVAARFGGDEFALLLPRTRASEARVVAERIRAEIAKRASRETTRPTVSIGIADLWGAGEPTHTALFDAADRALYTAKRNGRNRVHVHEVPLTSGVIRLDEVRTQKMKAVRNGA